MIRSPVSSACTKKRDAKNGSGFNFTDLTANLAGIRFGKMAVNSPADAKKRRTLSLRPRTSRYTCTNVRSLPQNLTSSEFEKRFGGTDSPAYQKIIQEIERRIAACPLYDRRIGMNERSEVR